MDRHEYDMLLGRLAVHFKILTKDQVGEALKRRRLVDEGIALSQFLVDEQYVTPEVLAKLDRAREQYLQKQGLEAPDPGDQTQPIAPTEPAAPEPVVAQPIEADPVEVEPVVVAPLVPEPAAPEAMIVEPILEADSGGMEFVDTAEAPEPIGLTGPTSQDALLVEPIYELASEPVIQAVGAAPAAVQPTAPAAAQVPPAIETAPIQVAPVEAAPVEAAPVEAAPVEAAPVQVAPVQAAPVQAAPVQAAPVQAAPVQAAPVQVGQGDQLLHVDASTTLENMLHQAQLLGASDLHLHSKAPIRLRLHGSMRDAGPIIDPERSRQLIFDLLSEPQQQVIEENLQLDFSYEIPGIGRFRSNAYKQQKGWDAVFRVIPANPPSLEQLGLPADLERVVSFHQGMVLFTGPAGCGKSSTMAAMVNLLNQRRLDHILTVEDPIEYVHKSAGCLINQREVGHHTESFARALRAALREDPDIIVIGELRDLETIELALTAAETGHLVLGTLHTSDAIRTINRLLGVFPPEQQNQIRTMVSESLRAVVSQRLVPRADDLGRVAAIEVLVNSKAVGNLIREKKTFQILSQMQTGSTRGMVMLDNSLADLVKQKVITLEQARRNAGDPKRFN